MLSLEPVCCTASPILKTRELGTYHECHGKACSASAIAEGNMFASPFQHCFKKPVQRIAKRLFEFGLGAVAFFLAVFLPSRARHCFSLPVIDLVFGEFEHGPRGCAFVAYACLG